MMAQVYRPGIGTEMLCAECGEFILGGKYGRVLCADCRADQREQAVKERAEFVRRYGIENDEVRREDLY